MEIVIQMCHRNRTNKKLHSKVDAKLLKNRYNTDIKTDIIIN